MAKHVGFLLLIGFAISAIAAASNGASKGDLDFANIAEHLESLTSPSASMGDIKDAVAPYLDNWRNKRSASSSMDNAGIESSPVRSFSSRLRDLNISGKMENFLKAIENLVAKIIKKIRQLILPAVKMFNVEKAFNTVDSFVTKLLKPLGINLEENSPQRNSIANFFSNIDQML